MSTAHLANRQLLRMYATATLVTWYICSQDRSYGTASRAVGTTLRMRPRHIQLTLR
ncbi:hypothetical protein FIBSPDRAFT_867703 [Athelia psychrophila]|uniref:Uncharacterized protein n=1 Tax=Athelia psychrophila TaxID=1759441 RepID=A0A166DUG7_9AGAM|nr:hypothetical protein FIBSPDRAFT_872549 [Fibularhizoctonia sp. CBS 109695]KZP15082.1 hypothetical protein FIBSPDRAFT_867703 [Fibularhizoctonia sp. CBS 109695]